MFYKSSELSSNQILFYQNIPRLCNNLLIPLDIKRSFILFYYYFLSFHPKHFTESTNSLKTSSFFLFKNLLAFKDVAYILEKLSSVGESSDE